MKQPLISVLLPVYNGQQYLAEAIQSILGQAFTDFELIIINDGSTDNSKQVVATFNDDRIRYYEQANTGLAGALNAAISVAKGSYFARQDQDDIALPERLGKQLEFLQNQEDYGMVGCKATIIKEQQLTKRTHSHPTDNGSLQFAILFDNPFVHSSVMIRRQAIETVGHYTTDPDRQPPEDYELWSRLARSYKIANLPLALQIYRETGGSMSRTGDNPFIDKVINRAVENISFWLGPEADQLIITDLAILAHRPVSKEAIKTNLSTVEDILVKLYHKALKSPDTDAKQLQKQYKSVLLNIRRHYPATKLWHFYYGLTWAYSRVLSRLGVA